LNNKKKIFKNKLKKYKKQFSQLVQLNILIFNFKLIDIKEIAKD